MVSTEVVQHRYSLGLKGFAILDGVLEICYFLLVLILRISSAASNGPPDWIVKLNTEHFKHDLTDASGFGFIFVLLFSICFVIPKLCGNVFLWRFVDKRDRKELPRWIVVTTMLCILGFLLLIPISRHDVYEFGISFIFAITTTVISFLTIILASAYFFTYAFDETELLDC